MTERAKRARGKPCPYCGKAMNGGHQRRSDYPTRDHVNPRVAGGGPTIMVCQGCNNDKGSKSLMEWADTLEARRDPRVHRVRPLAAALEAGTLRIDPASDAGTSTGVFA